MRIDDVKFTNIELLKEYVMILKEKKKNPGRNIEKLFNSFSLSLTISELMPMEYMILHELVSKVNIIDIKRGYSNCYMEKIPLSDEYKDTLEKTERIYRTIYSESKIDCLEYYYPFIGNEYTVTMDLIGYRIFQFFGTDIIQIFNEAKDNDGNELTWKDLIIQLFYQTFYNAFYNMLDFSTLNTSNDDPNQIVTDLMNKNHYNKITNSVCKVESIIGPHGIYLSFIDSKNSNLEEFTNLLKMYHEEEMNDIKIQFLCKSTLLTYLKYMNYVLDHESYRLICKRTDSRFDNKLDKYKTRLNQLMKEMNSERMYQIENEDNPIILSALLMPNILIKYRLSFSLKELLELNIKLNSSEPDIFFDDGGEFSKITNELNQTKNVLNSIIS